MTAWRILQRHFYQMQIWMHIPHPSDFCKQKKTQQGECWVKSTTAFGVTSQAEGEA
jgi:hypothetical protein